MRRYFDSIAFRISLSIAVVVAASTIAVGWLIMQDEKRTLEAELKSKGRYLAELMAHNVVEPLLYEERFAIYSLFEGSMKSAQSLIVYADVHDKRGEVVVSAARDDRYADIVHPRYEPNNAPGSVHIQEDPTLPLYHITMPVSVESLGTIGYLRLCITKEYLLGTLESVREKLYTFAAAVTFVGIVFGLMMARKVLNPVLILSKGVGRIGEGEVGVEVPVVGHGEIRDLSRSFNRMSLKLKDLIEKMKSAQDHLIKTEKLYAVGEFSAGIAHEIKNPLTPVMMLIHRVKEESESLTEKDIEVIDEALNRIDKIITEFLAFARPDKAEMQKVNMNEVLNEVVTITRPKMDRLNISFVEKYSPGLPEVAGNHDALKQVFLNIMLNAIQAMDDSGGELTVETLAFSDSIKVSVYDTGRGILAEDIPKIYDPFFTTKKDGTGMGLALTHNIISDHSGKIDIESVPGRGTIVKVKIPI